MILKKYNRDDIKNWAFFMILNITNFIWIEVIFWSIHYNGVFINILFCKSVCLNQDILESWIHFRKEKLSVARR